MRATITLNLPEDLKAALDEAALEEDQSRNDLMCEALQDYLFIRKFRLLREHMTSKAQTQGGYTDQDIFDRIS